MSLVNATLFFWIGQKNKVYVNDHDDCVDCHEDVDGSVIELRDGVTGIDTKHDLGNTSRNVIDDSQKWVIQ